MDGEVSLLPVKAQSLEILQSFLLWLIMDWKKSQAGIAWWVQRLVRNEFCGIRLLPEKPEFPAHNHHQPLPSKTKHADIILESLDPLLKKFHPGIRIRWSCIHSFSRRHRYLKLSRWKAASGWGSLIMELGSITKISAQELGSFKWSWMNPLLEQLGWKLRQISWGNPRVPPPQH